MSRSRTTTSDFSTLKKRESRDADRKGSASPSVRPPQGASDRRANPSPTFARAEPAVGAEALEHEPSAADLRMPLVAAETPSEAHAEEIAKTISAPESLNENWLERNGHSFTFAGIFFFTLVLYFRPYELIPALSGFDSIAWIAAVATLAIYLPTQITVEGSLTALPIEIKCILFMTAWALLTIPIAKDPALAWATFNDTFIKVVLIFIVMVNTLRTPLRIKALMWLGIGVGLMLSWQAVDLYMKGEFHTEGYRVSVDFGGMFGNPNDMSIHLVMFIPLAVALGAAARNLGAKLFFFISAVVMTAGSFVTQSRGAFLGLVAVSAVLVWKMGRRQRLKATLIAGLVGVTTILLAPGNYGIRILSIFLPSLDPVGSSDQRTDLLWRSILVSLRNPWGIGMGNFEIVGVYNLGTHNGFTQVSAELGLLAFAAYLIILLNPVRKLNLIEQQLIGRADPSWIYYASIGLQASIAGFIVSSFFSSVAYHWYVYYPVAYAIGVRRIYQLGGEQPNSATAIAGLEAQRA
ncbi:MAG: O-antigen ligase family protein [Pyrinomonadaceae bacterium]